MAIRIHETAPGEWRVSFNRTPLIVLKEWVWSPSGGRAFWVHAYSGECPEDCQTNGPLRFCHVQAGQLVGHVYGDSFRKPSKALAQKALGRLQHAKSLAALHRRFPQG